LADRVAGHFTYGLLALAAVTALGWWLVDPAKVFAVTLSVLVVTCPCALSLAAPAAFAAAGSRLLKQGILLTRGHALETLSHVNHVVFDKTGTLTEGQFGVVGIEVVEGQTEEKALALAAAVEGDSEHTIAQGIRASAEKRNLTIPEVSGFEAIKGKGALAHTRAHVLYVGGPRLLEMLKIQLPDALDRFERDASGKGQSVVHLVQTGHGGKDPQVLASFALADVIRQESREAVKKLQEMGVQVAMLTGDSQAVAKSVSDDLGIDVFFAEVLPDQKDAKVSELQQQGRQVAMVGDGVNDAPALTRANVGIAIGSGTDVAVESAGIILVRSDPLDVVKIIALSRASYRKMIQNLVWAAGYNVFALPLAAGVLAPIGILLSPAVGAILMSLSTIIVALNAQLLRRATL